jgi:glyoxylase-like metal-dependent hydrolase (beta-lactamase superfamily II)
MKDEGAPIALRASAERPLSILHENPHMLDGGETDFSVNTGTPLILVDAGGGVRLRGGTLGRFAASLRSAGCTPEDVDIVLATHPHSDHVGGLTTQDGKRALPNAEIYVAKVEGDFWLSPEIAAITTLMSWRPTASFTYTGT